MSPSEACGAPHGRTARALGECRGAPGERARPVADAFIRVAAGRAGRCALRRHGIDGATAALLLQRVLPEACPRFRLGHGEPIQRALKNVGRGMLIDHGLALGAAGIGGDQARSTAAVDSRSSHSAIGSSVKPAKLRAKARVDCARGPSVPSMLIGKPSTKPTARRSAASTRMRAASAPKRVRESSRPALQGAGPDRWPRRRWFWFRGPIRAARRAPEGAPPHP